MEYEKLDPVDLKILEMLIERPWLKNGQIASELDLDRTTIWRRINRDSFRQAASAAAEGNQKNLNVLSQKAISRLDDLVGDDDPRVALGAIKLALQLTPEQKETVAILKIKRAYGEPIEYKSESI